MIDKIKERLLKEIKSCNNKLEKTNPIGLTKEQAEYTNLCLEDSNLDSKLKQHEETKKEIINKIDEYNEKIYGHMKDSCESQEYDAIEKLKKEVSE